MKHNKTAICAGALAWVLMISSSPGFGQGGKTESVQDMVRQYEKASDTGMKREVLKRLHARTPESRIDLQELRPIFQRERWDEGLFASAMAMVNKATKPELAEDLIQILRDEKPAIERLDQGVSADKSAVELQYRQRNTEAIIRRLGQMRANQAVPILKEYLAIKATQYAASKALGVIGDKTTSEEIRQKAYAGEDLDYAGAGLEEAQTITKDLENRGKKGQWPKIAKQIIHIRSRDAKPLLKRLTGHEQDYVRREAALAYCKIADKADALQIGEMAESPDWFVRSRAIDAMKNARGDDFKDVLVRLLEKDRHRAVRRNVAKALGYLQISSAVPQLEKALRDADSTVRQNAFISLFILTGKKYDFEGRNEALDRTADREKETPSFDPI